MARDLRPQSPVRSDEAETERAWDIARAILRYLESRPDAKDTLEGIARWWLQREWSERVLNDVERAVNLLLSRRLIRETVRYGTPGYYQLDTTQKAVIARILRAP